MEPESNKYNHYNKSTLHSYQLMTTLMPHWNIASNADLTDLQSIDDIYAETQEATSTIQQLIDERTTASAERAKRYAKIILNSLEGVNADKIITWAAKNKEAYNVIHNLFDVLKKIDFSVEEKETEYQPLHELAIMVIGNMSMVNENEKYENKEYLINLENLQIADYIDSSVRHLLEGKPEPKNIDLDKVIGKVEDGAQKIDISGLNFYSVGHPFNKTDSYIDKIFDKKQPMYTLIAQNSGIDKQALKRILSCSAAKTLKHLDLSNATMEEGNTSNNSIGEQETLEIGAWELCNLETLILTNNPVTTLGLLKIVLSKDLPKLKSIEFSDVNMHRRSLKYLQGTAQERGIELIIHAKAPSPPPQRRQVQHGYYIADGDNSSSEDEGRNNPVDGYENR